MVMLAFAMMAVIRAIMPIRRSQKKSNARTTAKTKPSAPRH